MIARLRGFYAVLDREDEALARALVSVARVLQVRLKSASAADVVRVARMARRICDEVGAALVINDRVDLALACGADGVHLGQTDLPISAARRLAGERLWIGVSTHDLSQVERAVAAGADYLGFGPVFVTTTKQNPDPVQGLEGLRAAVRAAQSTPVVAIGGITAMQVAKVYAAGATAICAISAVNAARDIVAAGRALGRITP
ncbi:MAG: thiamine-phosphate pyrophosphorylase [Myxococcales bacterium]|nr:thiamine-phosphate pyrophosphorylase [Myxococcales bacterium]